MKSKSILKTCTDGTPAAVVHINVVYNKIFVLVHSSEEDLKESLGLNLEDKLIFNFFLNSTPPVRSKVVDLPCLMLLGRECRGAFLY